jgi:hypothetical protein
VRFLCGCSVAFLLFALLCGETFCHPRILLLLLGLNVTFTLLPFLGRDLLLICIMGRLQLLLVFFLELFSLFFAFLLVLELEDMQTLSPFKRGCNDGVFLVALTPLAEAQT